MSGPSDPSLRHDGDLLYLTDTAYFALVDHETGNRMPYKNKNIPDGLFLERLESFMEGQQKEIESFANREQRPVDEIRKLVAIPYARHIFSLDPSLPQPDENPPVNNIRNIPSIRGVLSRLSNTLQMLHDAAGLDSLLLVVSPRPTFPPTSSSIPANADSGSHHLSSIPSESFETSWIGGTDLGKEFWMGLKGGGVNGARAFRVKCQMQRDAEEGSADMIPSTAASLNSSQLTLIRTSASDGLPVTKMRSGDVKTELNAAVRHALRSVSGNPLAEMRWTKPASLEETYNVRLIGWPPGVNMRNPSNNSLRENRLLLDLVRSGRMRFVQKGSPDWGASFVTVQQVNPTLTKETVTQSKCSIAPLTISSHSSVVDTLKPPALTVEPEGTVQQPSQPSSHIPSSLSFPSSSPTPRLATAISGITVSIREVPDQSSMNTSSDPDSIASKRQVRDHTPESGTQNGRDAKRAKLDFTGGAE